MKDYFTLQELETISDVLCLAMLNNAEAVKLTISAEAIDALEIANGELRRLNTKVCNLMQEV